MSKKRKEREAEILKEMDEAMAEQQAQRGESAPKEKFKLYGIFEEKTPETLHCSRCRTELKDGVCPTCGFKTYVPMDEKKRKRIRWILTAVFLVGALVILLVTQLK